MPNVSADYIQLYLLQTGKEIEVSQKQIGSNINFLFEFHGLKMVCFRGQDPFKHAFISGIKVPLWVLGLSEMRGFSPNL